MRDFRSWVLNTNSPAAVSNPCTRCAPTVTQMAPSALFGDSTTANLRAFIFFLNEEEERSCQLDRQLMKHHRGDTPSWGCAPPIIHVLEGLRSFICVEARDLLLCTLSCRPVGSVLLSVSHPHKSLSLAVKPLFSQCDLASVRSVWYLRWALVPARTRTRYMRPASPGGAKSTSGGAVASVFLEVITSLSGRVASSMPLPHLPRLCNHARQSSRSRCVKCPL
jgi:hypothetical protein